LEVPTVPGQEHEPVFDSGRRDQSIRCAHIAAPPNTARPLSDVSINGQFFEWFEQALHRGFLGHLVGVQLAAGNYRIENAIFPTGLAEGVRLLQAIRTAVRRPSLPAIVLATSGYDQLRNQGTHLSVNNYVVRVPLVTPSPTIADLAAARVWLDGAERATLSSL
jgi:hypothetical protein